jgi:dihydrofolate reductase
MYRRVRVMRKIIESTLVSLDGVIEDPANWVGPYMDAAFQQAALERLLVSDAMLMGRRTYEILSRDWIGGTDDFAKRINAIPKYVFSSTMRSADWNNSTIVTGVVATEVRKLKEQPGGTDLTVYGHGRFAQTLLQCGLIDEMRLSVFPVIAGSGQLLFHEGQKAELKLIEVSALPSGIVVARYQPVSRI